MSDPGELDVGTGTFERSSEKVGPRIEPGIGSELNSARRVAGNDPDENFSKMRQKVRNLKTKVKTGGGHSTEEAFALPTQPSQARFSAPLSEWTANIKTMRTNQKKQRLRWGWRRQAWHSGIICASYPPVPGSNLAAGRINPKNLFYLRGIVDLGAFNI